MLDKKSILKNNKLKTQVVNVPEWGGDIIVSELTGTARDAWESDIISMSDDGGKINGINTRAKLIVISVVDEEGNLIFDEEDIEEVGNLSATALNRVFTVASKLSALTAADMKELEGN